MTVCCFCGDVIERHDKLAVLLSVQNIDARGSDIPVQALYAHGNCLAQKLDPDVPFLPEALVRDLNE